MTEIKLFKVAELKEQAGNPRTIKNEKFEKLKKSIMKKVR